MPQWSFDLGTCSIVWAQTQLMTSDLKTGYPLHQPLHLAHCSQVLLYWQPPNTGQTCNLSRYRTLLHWVFAPQHPVLCIAFLDVRCGCSCLAMKTYSIKLSVQCSWANLKATWGLEVCSDGLCRKLAHCVPQHLLTWLWDFMYCTSLWLKCCRSQALPLCHNTTNWSEWF